MDGTRFHYFTLESNPQTSKLIAAGESRLKLPKTQASAANVLRSVFWDVQDILFRNYFEKGRTFNSEYYIGLLVRLKNKSRKNGHK